MSLNSHNLFLKEKDLLHKLLVLDRNVFGDNQTHVIFILKIFKIRTYENGENHIIYCKYFDLTEPTNMSSSQNQGFIEESLIWSDEIEEII